MLKNAQSTQRNISSKYTNSNVNDNSPMIEAIGPVILEMMFMTFIWRH